MAKSTGNLESGLTRFLNTLYACFRFMSRFLVLCQFCECPTIKRKTTRKHNGDQSKDAKERDFERGAGFTNGEFSFPKRYILVIMTFLGFMNMYALRVNLNVAIGAMVNNHTIQLKGYTVVRVRIVISFKFPSVYVSRFLYSSKPSFYVRSKDCFHLSFKVNQRFMHRVLFLGRNRFKIGNNFR